MPISYASKKLLKDLKEITLEGKQNGVYVAPLEDNIFEWHGNIVPTSGRYQGMIMHCILNFPETYPTEPPTIKIGTHIPHSNIIEYGGEKNYLCLDLIKNFFWMESGQDKSMPYTGWSCAYSVMSIMLQLQTFLFEDFVEHYDGEIIHSFYELAPEYGGGPRTLETASKDLDLAFKEAKEFKCTKCGHCYEKPYPEILIEIPKRVHYPIRIELIKDKELHPKFQKYVDDMIKQISESLKDKSDYEILEKLYEKFYIKRFYQGLEEITERLKFEMDIFNERNLNNEYDEGNGWGVNESYILSYNYKNNYQNCTCDRCSALKDIHEEFKDKEFEDEKTEKESPKKNIKEEFLKELINKWNHRTELKVWMDLYQEGYDDLMNKNKKTIKKETKKESKADQFDMFDPTKKPSKDDTILNQLPEHLIYSLFECLTLKNRSKLSNSFESLQKYHLDPYFWEGNELSCYYTKKNFRETTLGFGISLKFFKKSPAIKEINTPLELLSREAFEKYKVRTSVWGQQFSMWLPIYINDSHGGSTEVRKLMEECITKLKFGLNYMDELDEKDTEIEDVGTLWYDEGEQLYNNSNFDQPNNVLVAHDPETGEALYNEQPKDKYKYAKSTLKSVWDKEKLKFKPIYALDILIKLMASIEIHMMKGNLYISFKALNAYCQIHRLLLQFIKWYPEIKTEVEFRLERFIKYPKSRNKQITPALKEMIALLTVSEKYNWHSISNAYLEESFDRGSRWILKQFPELAWVEDELEEFDQDRINKSFAATIVGKRSVVFSIYFCSIIAKPRNKTLEEIRNEYDQWYGFPSRINRFKFQQFLKKVNEMKDWETFFELINIYRPTGAPLADLLRQGVLNSEFRKYHSKKELRIDDSFKDSKRYGRNGWIPDKKFIWRDSKELWSGKDL